MHKVSSSTDFCILSIMLFLMGCMIRRKQMALVLAISSLLPIFLIKLQCTFRRSEHKGPLICADPFLPISSPQVFPPLASGWPWNADYYQLEQHLREVLLCTLQSTACCKGRVFAVGYGTCVGLCGPSVYWSFTPKGRVFSTLLFGACCVMWCLFLIQFTAFTQVARCSLRVGRKKWGFRDAEKQLFGVGISMLSGHHPLFLRQHIQYIELPLPFLGEQYQVASIAALMVVLWLPWFFFLSRWSCSCWLLWAHSQESVYSQHSLWYRLWGREDGWNCLRWAGLYLFVCHCTALSLGRKSLSCTTIHVSKSSCVESNSRIWATDLTGYLNLFSQRSWSSLVDVLHASNFL